MEELALRIPSREMNFVAELAVRMGWVLTKLGNWSDIRDTNTSETNFKTHKIKLPKGNGKTSQEAMEWVKSLVVKSGQPVPTEEDGRDCRTEKITLSF